MENQPEEPVKEAAVAEKKPEEATAKPKSPESVTEAVPDKPKDAVSVEEEKKSDQKKDGKDDVNESGKEEDKAKKRDSEAKKAEDPDETAEEFEDAVDTVGEPDDIELPEEFTAGGDSTRSSRHGSPRSNSEALGPESSDENLPKLRVTESETYEIESSPEKSPKAKPRPGPSKRRSPVKSPDIETVDLDDDDDDEDSFEEDDDYYDDPESDDQDVNRVIQDAVDEIDAMDNPESGEEDKMDVSSDDDDYSEDDDDQHRSIVIPKGGKRDRGSDYSEGEIYDEDDDGYEYDQVGEVDEPVGGRAFRPPKSRPLSLGQISVEDDSDEDVSQKKKVGGKVKYKTYDQKLIAGIRKRTFKILNKRSMHVMEEGSDALVCSDAKVVSLKSSSTVTASATTTTSTSSSSAKSPAPEEAHISGGKESESPATGEAQTKTKTKNDENKENMTVKDNTKELVTAAATTVLDEKVKAPAAKDDKKAESEEDVMSGVDDLGEEEDCKYRNGSKTEDFNDELTFQMDVDGSQPEDEDDDGDTEEGEDDDGAVDLSSNKSQTEETEPVELIDSSPEKSSNATSVTTKPARKPEVPAELEKPDLSRKDDSVEKVVKVEVVEPEEAEKRREESSVDLSSKSSPRASEKQPEKPVTVSRKRRRSVDEYEDEEDAEPLVPSKKLKRELECNFRAHDRLLKEYIETTSNDSMDDVQKNTDLLLVEIQTLNDMIRAKENEWNNMIHLKKVKEEILMRLTRKKHVMDIVHTKLGEPVSEYSLSNVRSASVGPRPPTPPPEVDIRPASVTPMHNRQNANTSSNSIDSRRLSALATSGSSKDHNSLLAHFNHSNSSVTMVPLSTSPSLITSTNTILQSRANMKPADVAKEKSNAVQIQRQILPKPILSNHQQILNNLAMSAGLTAASATSSGATSISNTTTTAAANTMAAAAIAANNILAGLGLSAQAAALLNGHHNPQQQHGNNQLQVGRQGVIKDVKSIIADYRQKHPEQVPRRGRRLKNIPSSAFDGGLNSKSGSSSTDARMRELSFLLAAAEDDEAEDSVDRLVIDEGDDHHHDGPVNNSSRDHHHRTREPSVVITARGGNAGGNGPEFHENDVPECQGCKKREAQFVCAGCGNQWYCSRECQVNAWDDHSEVCTG